LKKPEATGFFFSPGEKPFGTVTTLDRSPRAVEQPP
jgi:hypothetical protein